METGMPRFCTASLFSDSGEVRSDLELHTPMMKGALIYIGLSDPGEAGSDFELYTSMIGGEWSCISTVCLISPPRLTAHGTNLKNAWLPSGTEVCASFAGGAEPLPYGMRQIRVCTCFTVGAISYTHLTLPTILRV